MAFTGEVETCSNMAAWGEHSSGVPETAAKSLTLSASPLLGPPQTPSSRLKDFPLFSIPGLLPFSVPQAVPAWAPPRAP